MAEKNVIELIKQLRERTGAGMMDCKHALEANDLDVEKSIDWLREKGIAKSAKRAGRTASEGLAAVKTCDKCGKAVICEVNCETDFVSASDKFHHLVDTVVNYLMDNEPKSIDEAKEGTFTAFQDAGLALGEKLDFRRYGIIHLEEGQGFGSYIHLGGKIATLLVLKKADEELANNLAMHVCANAPLYTTLDSVPAEERERELAIARAEVADDPKLTNKPDAVKAQIVERKADKVLSASCLYLQEYLLDTTKKVGDVLKEKGNEVVSFLRFQVGDGIEKSEE